MAGAFEKLDAWKKSMELTTKIYRLTQNFPENEMLGLTAEIRQAAISIPSKIAQGSYESTIEYRLDNYETALSSSKELEHLTNIALDLGYMNKKEHEEIINGLASAQKPLRGLIKYTEKKSLNEFHRFKKEMLTTKIEALDLPENDKY